MIETRLREFMVADAGVSALIGTRWMALQVPQNPVYPLVIYQRIDDVPVYSHNLGSGQANMAWYRFQLTILANGKDSVKTVIAVKSAIADALRRFSGYNGPGSPPVTDQAANIILSGRMVPIPEPAQPLTTYVLDVRIFAEGD